MENIKKAAELIKSSKKVFALTGAGISTESGIPDFRSDRGYYRKFDPVRALSVDTMLGDPKRFYSEGYLILKDLNGKKPNDGHIALAKLESGGYLAGIVTQNIDNLHFEAGSKNVYEVHGETRGVHCMKCGSKYNFSYLEDRVDSGEIPPKCEKCGGIVRSNVVMFGDMMPDDYLRTVDELQDTDLLIVVGSSLTVSPVNFLPRYVKNLIIINNTPTPEDRRAKLIFRENSGKVLMDIYNEVMNG